MDASFETRTAGTWTVITARGELDLSTLESLHAALDSGLTETTPRLAIDLTEVSFMDSSNLGVLVASLKRARERGGELQLVGVNGSPAKVIELTGLDAAFPIVASVDDLPG